MQSNIMHHSPGGLLLHTLIHEEVLLHVQLLGSLLACSFFHVWFSIRAVRLPPRPSTAPSRWPCASAGWSTLPVVWGNLRLAADSSKLCGLREDSRGFLHRQLLLQRLPRSLCRSELVLRATARIVGSGMTRNDSGSSTVLQGLRALLDLAMLLSCKWLNGQIKLAECSKGLSCNALLSSSLSFSRSSTRTRMTSPTRRCI